MAAIPLANTTQQFLLEHCCAIGILSANFLERFAPTDIQLIRAALVSGALHDLGKLDPTFQAFLKKPKGTTDFGVDGVHIVSSKFSFEKHARHNEISLLLFDWLRDPADKSINRESLERIRHVIFWHHAQPLRKQEIKELDFICGSLTASLAGQFQAQFAALVLEFLTDLQLALKDYVQKDVPLLPRWEDLNALDDFNNLSTQPVPAYKRYSTAQSEFDGYRREVLRNAKNSVVRAAVITSDQLVSALPPAELKRHLKQRSLHEMVEQALFSDSNLVNEVEHCLAQFNQRFSKSERNYQQSKAAKKLSTGPSIGVLRGPAGLGKTKVALEAAFLSKAQKIFWVCPRVQVCLGIFSDLRSQEYLPGTSLEICTGEFKLMIQDGKQIITPEAQEFSGQIVITTIDQIINAITTHRNITTLIDVLSSYVVFDEFHEFVQLPGFNLLFSELVECKKLCSEGQRCLLVSATPHPLFVKEMLEIEPDEQVAIPSFNSAPYELEFAHYQENNSATNPLLKHQPPDSVVISNTATTAQLGFLSNYDSEESALFHSKLKKSDRLELFERIYQSHRQGGDHSIKVLRSGPILQAALNISCPRMVTEWTCAENWLQRMGRLNRFGEHAEGSLYLTAIPDNYDQSHRGSSVLFLRQIYQLESARAWYHFLQEKLASAEPPLTLNQLYSWYEEFHQHPDYVSAIESDLLRSLQNGAELIEKRVHNPVSFPKRSKSSACNQRLKAQSIRGDSRYVQLAVCATEGLHTLTFPDQYVTTADDVMTLSLQEIQGFDPHSDKDLLAYMYQKHHKILSAKEQKKVAQAYRVYHLEKAALLPEDPIFLSYTNADLSLCHDQASQYAIYYFQTPRQAVGALSLHKLQAS